MPSPWCEDQMVRGPQRMETMQHAVGNGQRQDQHNSQAQGPHSNVATNAQGVTICDSCQPRLYSSNEPYTGNGDKSGTAVARGDGRFRAPLLASHPCLIETHRRVATQLFTRSIKEGTDLYLLNKRTNR